jgi:hypothetical protein
MSANSSFSTLSVDSGRLGSVKRMFDMIGFWLVDHDGREVLGSQQGKRRTE